jgi:hypothetical protein
MEKMNPDEVRFDGATVHFAWPACATPVRPPTETPAQWPSLGMRKPAGRSTFTSTQQDPGVEDTADSVRPMLE